MSAAVPPPPPPPPMSAPVAPPATAAEPGPQPSVEAAPPPRPFALLVLAGLLLLKAAVLIGVVLNVGLAADSPLRSALRVSPELSQLLEGTVAADALLIAAAALLLVAAVGLVTLHRDAWLLAMILTGVFVAVDIFGYVNGSVNYVWMALNIVTVFYLNQTDVRSAVGVSTERLVPVGPPA